MAAVAKTKKWTAEEYLAFERSSDERHELIDGDVYLMTGASREHNVITTNVVVALGNQLAKRPCELYANDMRVKLAESDYAYPDIAVVCGEPKIVDDHFDMLLNPTLIIEVLSPSAEAYDRGAKAQLYRALPSLQEYLLISQTTPHIEQYVRQTDGQWLFSETTDMAGTIELPSIGCTLALADVYNKIRFEEGNL